MTLKNREWQDMPAENDREKQDVDETHKPMSDGAKKSRNAKSGDSEVRRRWSGDS